MTTFLEAKRLVAELRDAPELNALVALSGTGVPLRLYLQAAAARRGLRFEPEFLPFNTLQQHLVGPPPAQAEVILLTPWDLLPEADWRSGLPTRRIEVRAAIARAEATGHRLATRKGAHLHYLPAALPPLAEFPDENRTLRHAVGLVAAQAGARALPESAFSLSSYLASGCPVGGGSLGTVAEALVASVTASTSAPAKVLVTDFDNTLWRGVIAEDGLAGIAYRAEGAGYRHFIYQSLLKRLKEEGVLLVGVSRNDAAVALAPLSTGEMPLHREDFVAVVASYHAKSAQIRQLAPELNLGLDSFVFVDDNPVELEEVRRALPEVTVVQFPARDEDLPTLLDDLAARFGRREFTAEDRDRTALYRRRLEGLAPVEAAGANLEEFLAGLHMRLVVHDRSSGDRTRAVQLINKTNQFNANGRRWTDEEVAGVLAAGGRLYAATLSDRTGSHGEVIACLLDQAGTVAAFVMSCRVFQRRAEHAFLGALIERGRAPAAVRFARTERNEPFARFLEEPGFAEAEPGVWAFTADAFLAAHADDLKLIEVRWD